MLESEENVIPEGKILKTSITKAELADLPAMPCRGKVIVVDSNEQVESAVATLSSYELIGFDTETKPSFRRGEKHFVSLLQLSTGEETFLFRLNMIGMPDGVRKLLEEERPKKIGLSIHDDFLNLKRKFPLEPKGFVELQEFVKIYNIADNSLSRIYAILFEHRISKGQRLSNWEAPILTLHQKEYAALDAIACLDIYNHLAANGFDYKQSKYYRLFDDPNYLIQTQKEENSTTTKPKKKKDNAK